MDHMISIIVPVYNAQKYLSECIGSIMEQTYKNLEIILVDDGSTDNSGNLCDQYKDMDPRIHVLHKMNGGVSDARNHGLNMARGDYIGFVDSDDHVEPDMYETLLKLCMENHIKLACTGYKIIGNSSPKVTRPRERETILSSDDLLKYIILGDNQINVPNAVWNRLYHRDTIKGIRFPKGKNYGEEIVFNTKVIMNAGKCIYTDRQLYHYRVRDGSITRSEKGNLYDQKVAIDLIDLYIEQIDLLYSYKKEDLAMIARAKAYQHFLKIYSLNEDKEFNELLKNTLNEWRLNLGDMIRLPIKMDKKIRIILKTLLPSIFQKKYRVLS